MKKIMLLTFILSLFFALTINASATVCDWKNYGNNQRISFTQNDCDTQITDTFTASSQNNILSSYSPLIADLNNDGINEIVMTEASSNEIRILIMLILIYHQLILILI